MTPGLCRWQKENNALSEYFSLHTHSKFSKNDALPSVANLVQQARILEMPAIGLTDHGTVGGIVQLYQHCHKKTVDILPVPGVEVYIASSRFEQRPKTFHNCIAATTTLGWRNLIGLVNLSHRQSKYAKPTLDFDNLASLGQDGLLAGLWITTGCWFGSIASAFRSEVAGAGNADNVVGAFINAFDGRVLVELQNHRIETPGHDDEVLTKQLIALAKRHGLPLVVTNDSHYLFPNDKDAHETLKRLSSFSTNVDEALFPGDGYHLCSATEMATRFHPTIYQGGLHGLHHMLSGYDLVVSELDTFKMSVPDLRLFDPNDTLQIKCSTVIQNKGLSDVYRDRLDQEMKVITTAGFSSYLLLVARLCDQMKKMGVMFNARGSASGSLVCWLLGITAIDPMKFPRMRFDRFLSNDRTKPPDIDLDLDSLRRGEVLDWLSTTYSAAHIGTWTSLGLDDTKDKGSLRVKYASMQRKMVGGTPGEISLSDLSDLSALAGHAAYTSTGTHPAGVVVVSDDSVLDQIPLQWTKSGFITAWSGPDIESMGYVKMDLLGLRTLSALRIALEIVGITFEEVPWTDPTVYRRICKGRTTGLFQLDGFSQRNGCAKLQPKVFDDLCLALALFRPAMMNNGRVEQVLDRRFGRAQVPQLHEYLASQTKDTYGVLIYQEQMLAVLRSLGLSSEEVSATLKAIKASNANVTAAATHMNAIKGRISDEARNAGFSDSDLDLLLKSLAGYADYGFAFAHAVAYARVVFVTGWLATRHPVAWYTGLLNTCHSDKVTDTMKAARADKISLLPPHINHSTAAYTPDLSRRAIRRGLTAIDGVGAKAAIELAAHSPYTSIADLVERTNNRIITGKPMWLRSHDIRSSNGVLLALANSGAVDGLEES
jgi:DNA polymerase III subunit alpha